MSSHLNLNSVLYQLLVAEAGRAPNSLNSTFPHPASAYQGPLGCHPKAPSQEGASVMIVFSLHVRRSPLSARCRNWRRIGWLCSFACSHWGARPVPELAMASTICCSHLPAETRGSRWRGSSAVKERSRLCVGMGQNIGVHILCVNGQTHKFFSGR